MGDSNQSKELIIQKKKLRPTDMFIMVMNSKKHNNIYELSKQIEEEDCKAYEVEAKKIISAYR